MQRTYNNPKFNTSGNSVTKDDDYEFDKGETLVSFGLLLALGITVCLALYSVTIFI